MTTNKTPEVLREILNMGKPDFFVEVTPCYEEGLVEVHTLGNMLELSITDAEELGHKLLAAAQDYHLRQQGHVVDPRDRFEDEPTIPFK